MTCDERRDLLLLYAAGAMEPAEMEEMRAHLASGCVACAGALAEAQATFAAVGLGADSVQPSAKAKQRLMDKVDRHAEATELPDNWAMRIFKVLVPMAVAAGLAIVITHYVVTKDVQNQAVNSQALQAMLASRDMEIRTLAGQLQSQQKVVDLIKNLDLKLVQLDGGKLQPTAVAGLLWDQKAGQWIVLASGMTAPPTGRTYELWYITADSKKIAAGTFDVDAKGNGQIVAKIPANIGTIAVAAITDEPIGGLAQPTGDIQLSAKLQ